ncbi:MAG: GNAT family N-acetyltransferase [Blastocatellia bacterium]
MMSSRLTYEQLEPSHLDEFHSFMRDDQVRRYLLGGNIFPVEWSAERIQDSQALFKRRGVGFWLVRQQTSGELLGFCGFMEIPSVHPEPQIIYALFRRFSGKGHATEMARFCIAQARAQGFRDIVASVDAENVASLRVLEKLGFGRISTLEGSVGKTFVLQLTGDCG